MSADVDGWDALRKRVFNRDMGCIVPTVDPRNLYPCKGMPTLDQWDLTMGDVELF